MISAALYIKESGYVSESGALLCRKNQADDAGVARAYFLLSSDAPDYLNKAEATLHELIISIDTSVDTVGQNKVLRS